MATDFKKMLLINFGISMVLILFVCGASIAQTTNDSVKSCPVKSLPDIFKKKDSVLVLKPVKNSFFLVIPVIGSQPATGFIYGGIGQYTFKGKKQEDKYSTVNLSVTYTTKQQLLVNVKNNLLLKNNKIFFSGDWRYYIFSQDNYGLGSDIIPPNRRDDGFDINALREPMDYNYFKFHQTVSWNVGGNSFIGAGLHLDGYTEIQDKNLDIDNGLFTEHYNYSEKYGFSNKEYYVNGFSFNFIHDSRDNQINANNGWYGNINYRFNPSLGENQKASSVLFGEYRYFKPLSATNKQHVFCVWAQGQFLTSGTVPYLNLPAIGWDQRSRSGKGYTQGLFRGYNYVNMEVEYRFPISCNQLLSGTVFANATSTSDKDRDIRLLQYIQPAIGVGFRVLIDKATRTNLIVNYAWGRDSEAFYLNAGETF
jgi:hypothetical protein